MAAEPGLGFESITATTVQSLTPPSGAIGCDISVGGTGVRVRDDGVAPTTTVGFTRSKNTTFRYTGDLSKFQVIGITAGATIEVMYFGEPNTA